MNLKQINWSAHFTASGSFHSIWHIFLRLSFTVVQKHFGHPVAYFPTCLQINLLPDCVTPFLNSDPLTAQWNNLHFSVQFFLLFKKLMEFCEKQNEFSSWWYLQVVMYMWTTPPYHRVANKLGKSIFLADEWQQFAAPPCFWDIGLSPLFARHHHQGWNCQSNEYFREKLKSKFFFPKTSCVLTQTKLTLSDDDGRCNHFSAGQLSFYHMRREQRQRFWASARP